MRIKPNVTEFVLSASLTSIIVRKLQKRLQRIQITFPMNTIRFVFLLLLTKDIADTRTNLELR